MRTYAMDALRVFVLKIAQAPQAGRFLASLVAGAPDTIALATAVPVAAEARLLRQRRLHPRRPGGAAASRRRRSTAFPKTSGRARSPAPAAWATPAPARPASWKGGLASSDVHVLVFLFAQTAAIREQVRRACAPGCRRRASPKSRPTTPIRCRATCRTSAIATASRSRRSRAACRRSCRTCCRRRPPGSSSSATPANTPISPIRCRSRPLQLGHNGSFVAFRILAQDCHGFEQFLVDAARQTGLDPEMVAAKLCGRWRNGVPLALSPQSPDGPVPLEKFNSFDYVPTDVGAGRGRRSPRLPLSDRIAHSPDEPPAFDGRGQQRPEAPDRAPRAAVRAAVRSRNPSDGIERGLLGLFIGVSLKDQFEFLMSDWANKGAFAPGLQGHARSDPGRSRVAGHVPAPGRGPQADRGHRHVPLRDLPRCGLLLSAERDWRELSRHCRRCIGPSMADIFVSYKREDRAAAFTARLR